MSLSVIIVTLNRPDCVERCLECLRGQTAPADQVIVVDGSTDQRTRELVERFPEVTYVRNENGWGRMTASRNLGLLAATGEVVAYIDDDAYAHAGWVEHLVGAYDDPAVGAVGGRALNGQVGEAERGVNEIGQLTASGRVTGNFAADSGRIVEVDHMIGCNMSFRRAAIATLGGFHEFYPGHCSTYEEVDLCIRVQRAGYRILYNPAACVDHEGAPRTVGRRFNARYIFGTTRNNATLMVRNFGVLSGRTWRYAGAGLGRLIHEAIRKAGGVVLRFIVGLAGLTVGLAGGVVQRLRQGNDPVRRDEAGRAIAAKLGAEPSAAEPTSSEERIPEPVAEGQ